MLQEPETWGGIGGVEQVYDASHYPDGTLRGYRFLAEAGLKPYEGSAHTIEADAPALMVVTVDAAEIEGTITTELRFRRLYQDLMIDKGWSTPDIVMEERTELWRCYYFPIARREGQ